MMATANAGHVRVMNTPTTPGPSLVVISMEKRLLTFWKFSIMNDNGNKLAIGAPNNDGNGSNAGTSAFISTPITLGPSSVVISMGKLQEMNQDGHHH